MKDMLMRALDTAQKRGASYADARYVETEVQTILVRNGFLEVVRSMTSRGVGVRVIVSGAWGFASTARLTAREMDSVAGNAVRIAKASSMVQREKVDIGEPYKFVASYKTPITKDPFAIPLSEKVDLLLKACAGIKAAGKEITVATANTEIQRTKKIFASTEGSCIEQEIIETGGGIEATSVGNDDMQNRSYPNSGGIHEGTAGWEFIERYDLAGNAPRIGEEAIALLTAKQCPAGSLTVILDGSQTALQVHESCGHAIELDRIMGMEAAFAGTSFLSVDHLNNLQYASDRVTLTIDATIPGGLGTFGYDDEGVPAQRAEVVRNGVLVGFLTSRETAAKLGQRSVGSNRASSWNRIPLIRMTNVNLEPGDWRLPDLIADTDDGIYMQTNRSWSIDDRRLNFQFGTEIAWEIKGGKLSAMLKNATYTGMTPQFWGSCDAICGDNDWVIWGTPNCGKGQPEQVGHVGHGAAPARFRNIRIGVMA